jgi:predicted DNA binding CopG/RHH family protein
MKKKFFSKILSQVENTINYTGVEMQTKLTQEEEQIVDYVESGKAESVEDLQEEIARFTQMAKEQTSKKKAISIRLSESDLYLLKKKALAAGISYQNIIQSLIHQYTHDKIKASL